MRKLYEDQVLTVEVNSSGEIFITPNHAQSAKIRIGGDEKHLIIRSHNGKMIPCKLNGMSVVKVTE